MRLLVIICTLRVWLKERPCLHPAEDMQPQEGCKPARHEGGCAGVGGEVRAACATSEASKDGQGKISTHFYKK